MMVRHKRLILDKKSLVKKAKYSLRWLPDEAYIRLYFRLRMHKSCDLKNPKTFNEKLQWLKLHDRYPRYTDMVDKVEAKKIAAAIVGDEHIIPTLGVWGSFDEIDFSSLPEQFVLKCSHDSEGLVIVKDKSNLDLAAARKKIESAMRYNFYYVGREWPYKNVRPRILAEAYLEDTACGELRDYKFYCFDGEPKMMFVVTGRAAGDTRIDFFDLDFKHLPVTQHYPNADFEIKKPKTFDQMVAAAKKLSAGLTHVRIDFYEVNGKMYFGEYTFFDNSGFGPFDQPEWDERLGSWIKLPEVRC